MTLFEFAVALSGMEARLPDLGLFLLVGIVLVLVGIVVLFFRLDAGGKGLSPDQLQVESDRTRQAIEEAVRQKAGIFADEMQSGPEGDEADE